RAARASRATWSSGGCDKSSWSWSYSSVFSSPILLRIRRSDLDVGGSLGEADQGFPARVKAWPCYAWRERSPSAELKRYCPSRRTQRPELTRRERLNELQPPSSQPYRSRRARRRLPCRR